MKPRFTVCLPTRNRRNWLPGAIDSVLNQTYQDWQLIVLDNGPEDRVADLIPTDPRVWYVCEPGIQGMVAAHNAAYELAQGELMLGLADDDRLPEHALATYDAAIGDAQWVVACCHIIDEAGAVLHYRGGTRQNVEATRRGNMMLGGAICWRRDFYQQIGGLDPAYDGAPDFEWYCRMLDAAEPVVIPDVCHIYTDHPETMSRLNAGNQAAAAAAVRSTR